MNLSVAKKLREHYVDNNPWHTHVSMVAPKGKFLLDRENLENFWDIYCDEVKEGKTILGVAEKPQKYLPVLGDIDLKALVDDDQELGEHLYSEEQIKQVISVYQSVLRNIVDNCRDYYLLCVVLEKPMYFIHAGEKTYVKNGFHLHFPNLFLSRADQNIHVIPRIKEQLKELETFKDIGFENSGDVIDKCCCNVPWLMLGSRKSEDMDPYGVTKIIGSDGTEIDINLAFRNYKIFDMHETPVEIKGRIEYYMPRILSILPYGREVLELRRGIVSPIKTRLRKEGNKKDKKKYLKITTTEALEKSGELLKKMIADWRADDRNEWIRIGWILFNIGEGSNEALDQWISFSSRCEDKFDETICIYEWDRMVKKDLGLGTLRHLAKLDNPKKYEEFKKEQTKTHLKDSIKGSHNDIAKALYSMYGDEFVCASISGKTWYQFRKPVWEEVEEGTTLRARISEDIVKDLTKMLSELNKEVEENAEDKSDVNVIMKRSQQIYKLIANLKSAPYKNNIMKEAMEVFYDRRFKAKLNQNGHLIAFKNGVYDLKNNIFRDGLPEDFLSKHIPIEYKEYNESDEDVQNVIEFLQKIFPDKSVRTYFLDTYSDIFVGGNPQKKVYLWTGDGDNGKSITQTFFEKMLGELAIKFNTQYFTGKKNINWIGKPRVG